MKMMDRNRIFRENCKQYHKEKKILWKYVLMMQNRKTDIS